MKYLFTLYFLTFSYFGIAQHQDNVDFTNASVLIEPIPAKKQINASVNYTFDVLKDIDSIFLDAKKMNFSKIQLNGKKIKYVNDSTRITIFKKFKSKTHYTLTLEYSCNPKQTVYFLGWDDTVKGNEQIWTQGQGKYTSHWLPSFDAMEEKVEFDLSITTSADLQVIANGKLQNTKNRPGGLSTWNFDMKHPMSSYLLAFVIGDYSKQELKSNSGITIENYYYTRDSLKIEPTYRYTKEIFNFLENEIGVVYPWQNYKQIPVRDFLYSGMENTSATIFSDQFMIDSTAYIDKNYFNVNAHELAHQWFGDLVTEKSGSHHWLQEGFATYYAYLTAQHIFGDDHFYWKLYNTAKELQELSENGAGQALTNPKASSATFYEKGAWALVMLKEQIGVEAFKKGIEAYLNKYKYENVTISNFIMEMELASGQNLDTYTAKWLFATEFPMEDVKTYLMTHNASIREFLVSKPSDINNILELLKGEQPTAYKIALIEEFKDEFTAKQLLYISTNPDIEVRQKAILFLDKFPSTGDEFEIIAEKHLKDKSYLTQEAALYKLWASYPENQAKYLDATKHLIGLPNKNIRLLWLTLSILTEGYESLQTKAYFQELSKYTGAEYSFEIRLGAFFYLKETFGFNQVALLNLVKATNHHSWQFKKFARNTLDALLTDDDYKSRLKKIAEELNSEENHYLISKLKN